MEYLFILLFQRNKRYSLKKEERCKSYECSNKMDKYREEIFD